MRCISLFPLLNQRYVCNVSQRLIQSLRAFSVKSIKVDILYVLRLRVYHFYPVFLGYYTLSLPYTNMIALVEAGTILLYPKANHRHNFSLFVNEPAT